MSNIRTGNTIFSAYQGTAANQPPNWSFEQRPPTQFDINYSVGDLWLDQSATPEPEAWILVSLAGNGSIPGELAHWIRFTGAFGNVDTLTGDTGGPVPPDGNGNINTLGTANRITTTGNPATNTITWDIGGTVAASFPTDSGTAVPAANVLNIIADNANLECGSSVLFTGAGNTVTLHVTDSDSNTIIGKNAGNLTLTASGSTGLGSGTLFNLTSGNSNTAVGINALQAATTVTGAVAVGATAMDALTTSPGNTAVGFSALGAITSGPGLNTAVGYQASASCTTGTNNAVVGYNALTTATTASNNAVLGYTALTAATTSSRGVAVGSGALATITTGDDNVAVGHNALNAKQTGGREVAIGAFALASAVTGSDLNVAIGYTAMQDLTTGTGNVAIGYTAADNITTGSANVVIGGSSGNALTTGTGNTILGASLGNSITTGSFNTFIGYLGTDAISTGDYNILFGDTANYQTGTESSNIIINNDGVNGENNTIRIGQQGGGANQQNRCFVAGIRGVTTGVNDAIAVLIDSAGQLGTVSSSIRNKENIKDMGHESAAVMSLRPVIFNYKSDEKKGKQYGLIAEEVAEVFPSLVVYDKEGSAETVKYHELPVMLLNELQKQRKTIDALSMTIRHLENMLQSNDCSCRR